MLLPTFSRLGTQIVIGLQSDLQRFFFVFLRTKPVRRAASMSSQILSASDVLLGIRGLLGVWGGTLPLIRGFCTCF